jgi:hypothetical protein
MRRTHVVLASIGVVVLAATAAEAQNGTRRCTSCAG